MRKIYAKGCLVLCLLFLRPVLSYAHKQKTPQGGIGITVEELKTGQLVVTGVVKAGPADLKGVCPGDVITHIDGVRSEQIPFGEISEHYLEGYIGSSVLLSVRRDGVPEILEIKINRWQRIDRDPKPHDVDHSHSE